MNTAPTELVKPAQDPYEKYDLGVGYQSVNAFIAKIEAIVAQYKAKTGVIPTNIVISPAEYSEVLGNLLWDHMRLMLLRSRECPVGKIMFTTLHPDYS